RRRSMSLASAVDRRPGPRAAGRRATRARRAAYYLILTGAVGVAYVAAVFVFSVILHAGALTDSPAFPCLFASAPLLLFAPPRPRLQALVDHLVSRPRYDGARVLATVGGELAATLEREQIVALVRSCVDEAIPNVGTRLMIARPRDGALP